LNFFKIFHYYGSCKRKLNEGTVQKKKKYVCMGDTMKLKLSQANFSTWSRWNISKEWFYKSYLNSSSSKECKQIYARPKINPSQILVEDELITSALSLQIKLNRINVLVIALKFFNRIAYFWIEVGIRSSKELGP